LSSEIIESAKLVSVDLYLEKRVNPESRHGWRIA